jgi:hypothetical protein
MMSANFFTETPFSLWSQPDDRFKVAMLHAVSHLTMRSGCRATCLAVQFLLKESRRPLCPEIDWVSTGDQIAVARKRAHRVMRKLNEMVLPPTLPPVPMATPE